MNSLIQKRYEANPRARVSILFGICRGSLCFFTCESDQPINSPHPWPRECRVAHAGPTARRPMADIAQKSNTLLPGKCTAIRGINRNAATVCAFPRRVNKPRHANEAERNNTQCAMQNVCLPNSWVPRRASPGAPFVLWGQHRHPACSSTFKFGCWCPMRRAISIRSVLPPAQQPPHLTAATPRPASPAPAPSPRSTAAQTRS